MPLVLCDEIWTVDLQPVLCTAHCVWWHAILLKDESSGQQAIAFIENSLKDRKFSDNLYI